MSGPLKAAWGLTAFVIVVGAVLWAATGQTVFAVFIVLGVLTGLGAWFTGRSETRARTTTGAPTPRTPSQEDS
jgi:dolichol kinase